LNKDVNERLQQSFLGKRELNGGMNVPELLQIAKSFGFKGKIKIMFLVP